MKKINILLLILMPFSFLAMDNLLKISNLPIPYCLTELTHSSSRPTVKKIGYYTMPIQNLGKDAEDF